MPTQGILRSLPELKQLLVVTEVRLMPSDTVLNAATMGLCLSKRAKLGLSDLPIRLQAQPMLTVTIIRLARCAPQGLLALRPIARSTLGRANPT